MSNLKSAIEAWLRETRPKAKEHVYAQVTEYMYKLLTEESTDIFNALDEVIPPPPHPSNFRPFF